MHEFLVTVVTCSGVVHNVAVGGSAMSDRRFVAALIGLAVLVISLGSLVPPGTSGTVVAQVGPGVTAQGTPTPGAPGSPQGPGAPGYGPRRPGFGPGFGPGYGPRFHRGRGRGYGGGGGITAGVFALQALLRFLLLIALLVIAWKVITSPTLWGRPDAAVQAIRERFARGEITEEEYRRRLAAL